MAPALPAPPRVLDEARRALASVDNFSHMEDDDMGLQHQSALPKDSQDMDQILVDLGGGDLAQTDLLQAIKTLEGGTDADAIFPLSGFDLADAAESEGDQTEDKIKQQQARLERRCAFLQRRLRILQARALGKRVSEEAAQTFEKCTKGARKDGAGRPIGLKALLKKIETTSALQASAASRTVVGPKYFHVGTSKGDSARSASAGIASGTLTGLDDTAGALKSHLSVVKQELDSDATASSSGAESNDEAIAYNNPHQQHMPIEKRALWTYQRARASIASRWCWLQAQVQQLEYKIRQHNDLHKQVRETKGPVEFEGEPVGYEGELPGLSTERTDNDPSLETCARVRPLRRDTFKKRKLLQMHNLHIATNKAAKPADIRCGCRHGVESCPVCTGRGAGAAPASSAPAPRDAIAQHLPSYHPVLSDLNDVAAWLHGASLCARAWFRSRQLSRHTAPPPPPALPASASVSVSTLSAPLRKHPTRLKRGRPPLSRKIRERQRLSEETSQDSKSRSRTSTETRGSRRQSFDIDNIVIPSSAATNRPTILTYKEILTPKWRVMEIPNAPLNNGVSKSYRMSVDSDTSEEEDMSERSIVARHVRCESRERTRYLSRPRRRNTNPHPPDLTLPPPEPLPLPEPPPPPPTEPSPDREVVRPYSPRQFPLPDQTYMSMLSMMPTGHVVVPPEIEPVPDEVLEDDSSTLSPLSNTPYDGDDPDDAEWDPSAEKQDKRKSTFR